MQALSQKKFFLDFLKKSNYLILVVNSVFLMDQASDHEEIRHKVGINESLKIKINIV